MQRAFVNYNEEQDKVIYVPVYIYFSTVLHVNCRTVQHASLSLYFYIYIYIYASNCTRINQFIHSTSWQQR